LPIGKKYNIAIPDIFLESREFKISVVRGIFDTEGCIYLQPKYGRLYPRIEIGTISPFLGEQLNEILNEVGLRATVYSQARIRKSWKEVYKISIRGLEMFDRFMEIIKPANPKHIRKHIFFKESFK